VIFQIRAIQVYVRCSDEVRERERSRVKFAETGDHRAITGRDPKEIAVIGAQPVGGDAVEICIAPNRKLAGWSNPLIFVVMVEYMKGRQFARCSDLEYRPLVE